MIRVGLLYDSVSDNIGDKAIGISLVQFCQQQGFNYEIVNPFRFEPQRYSTVIVGGGDLIREPGDPFYDAFRVKGAYMLNAVGVSSAKQLDYLKQYRYLSVRSLADKARLPKGLGKVSVIPCTSLTLKGKPTKLTARAQAKAGIHLVASVLGAGGVERVIETIKDSKIFFSITRYNYDKSLMQQAFNLKSNQIVATADPQVAFSAIGKLKYLITSSLHATIFAYAQNVPFLSFDQPKVRYFLEERGLKHLLFANGQQLRAKLPYLTSKRPDFKTKVKRDHQLLKHHFDQLAQIITTSSQVAEATVPAEPVETLQATQLRIRQLEDVIVGRDLLLGGKLRDLKRLQGNIQTTEAANAELRATLSGIYHSRSWRFLQALRRLLFWKQP